MLVVFCGMVCLVFFSCMMGMLRICVLILCSIGICSRGMGILLCGFVCFSWLLVVFVVLFIGCSVFDVVVVLVVFLACGGSSGTCE